ncbi:YbaB/EbfC family nucleoid-associated protein [Streptomyces sp. NPDC005483]|uniref:YbaB/EbfC family nucleoid-associated protein n=1 Tax=Streptomyces sp. NPDC005483 TaxID=3154882 RepID=UPI0033B4AB5B
MTQNDDGVNRLIGRINELQRGLAAAHAGRSTESVTETAGGGLVRATVSATGALQDLRISPLLADPSDPETLADTVVAAVQGAQKAVVARYRKRFEGLVDIP